MSLGSGLPTASVPAKGVKDRFGPVSKSHNSVSSVSGFRSYRQIARSSKPTGIKSFARKALMGTVLAVVAIMVMMASVASAAPKLQVFSTSNTTAPPGGTINYYLTVSNVGDETTSGDLKLQATFPAGITAVSSASFPDITVWDCSSTTFPASTVTCTFSGTQNPHDVADPFDDRTTSLMLTADVDPGTSGVLTNSFTVSGGGSAPATTVDPTTITATTPGFGVDAFDGQVTADAEGNPYTQAGGHPYAASTTILFNTLTNSNPFQGDTWPVEQAKDVFVDLPPGFLGDPTVTGTATCTQVQLANSEFSEPRPLCPPGSQVGVTTVFTSGGVVIGNPLPVFNVVPPVGVPARFGFNVAGSVVTLDAAIRSGTDYGATGKVRNVSEGLAITGTTLTLWGVPADPSHDLERACPDEAAPWSGGPSCTTEAPRRPFLRNPTSCTPAGVGLPTTLRVDSWFHPGVFQTASFTSHSPPGYPSVPGEWGAPVGTTGCGHVPFHPSFSATPDEVRIGAPTGFSFDLTLPQSEDPDAIGTADLKKSIVTLPEGVTLNPAAAGGLGSCSSAQIGLLGTEFPLPNPIHFSESEPSCPQNSRVGTLSVKTPLLEEPLQGSVYLAAQNDNPFHSLLAIYLVAKGPGVLLKLPGLVQADPATGRLTATFDHNPQLPFSDLHLQFKGGPRAPLVNPRSCGTYTTTSDLTPWSAPFTPDASPHSSFQINEGCGASQFSPAFTAGVDGPVAGGFSPFSLQLTRSDQDGEFASLSSLRLPPGLIADVSSVSPRCTDAQAAATACPAASHIGEVIVGAGVGPNPFYVGGDVYLTDAYKGNPFGLAIVVHAVAGPFDLGYVVVRAGVQVHDDGSITTVTDPFPTILQGIPLQVRDVRVNLDRQNFIINPTRCNSMSINGTAVSTENQTAQLASHFQVGECSKLKFHPDFKVSTSGKTSKAAGASLRVHLGTHQGPGAGEANIAKVNVQLPVILPSRLTTLQQACPAAQFAKDPAGCPEGSFVGTAIAHTPILTSALAGPAILVSHGGVAFPDLVLVLQGEGVRIDLTGHTQIKKGITFSRFETVPDAPVSSFDLNFPQGPHSVLTATGSLCANTKTVRVKKHVIRRVKGHSRKVTIRVKKTLPAPLSMPTTITAQNGAVLQQTTKIAVTGCAKATASGHARKATKAKTGNSRRSRR
jgi:uncharacterized repeat protein (TIGR01451 family)